MSAGWTIAKDALSLFGAIAVSVPWFLDFAGRVDIHRLKGVPTSITTFQNLVSKDEAWLAAPKLRDLVLTSLGLLAFCASFLIALLQSLGGLSGG
jgi:hypothetical protein